MVLGMHRSGTSCLTGSLQQAGVYLGDVVTYRGDNQKGNRERVEIKELNDEVLQYSGGTWDNPPSSVQWTREHALKRDQFLGELRAAPSRWSGSKDPRTVITLPFWLEGIHKKELALVGTFRHPLLVAQSLHDRHPEQSIERFLDLWYIYNERFLELHLKYHFPLLNFDVDAKQYIQDMQRLFDSVGLKKNAAEITFFDQQLKHQSMHHQAALPQKIQQLYETLLRRYQEQI